VTPRAGGARRAGRTLQVVELYALGCFVFSALVAVTAPESLSSPPLDLSIGIRTDTLGAAAFVVAALVTLPRRWLNAGRRWNGARPHGASDALEPADLAVWRAVRDLSLLVALYIVANYLNHPRTMTMPLTHFASWPSERVTGLTAALVSFVAALAAQLRR